MKKPTFKDIENWCVENDIIIHAVKETETTVRIVVNYKNNEPKIGVKTYKIANHESGDKKWWDVIRILQLKYYKQTNH